MILISISAKHLFRGSYLNDLLAVPGGVVLGKRFHAAFKNWFMERWEGEGTPHRRRSNPVQGGPRGGFPAKP